MTQESQEMEAEEDTNQGNASLYRLAGPNWTMAGGDDDDEYYLEELEESRAKQFGPAAKKGRSKKLSRVFRYREEKLERLERVVELTTEVYNEAIGRIGDGAASLERLHLLDRRNKILDKVEAQILCDVVMAAIDEKMQEAGFEGLERPLVELEVLHVRKLIGAELWCPKWFVEGKPINNPVKDSLYYILYRRNYNVVMKMGKIVIHTYAAAYGLRNIFIRPSTVEYLEMAMKLRNRTKRGILILEKVEIRELEERRDLQEMILTRLGEEDLSNLTAANSVPWLRSFAAINILAATVMGVPQWRKMLESFRSKMTLYGLAALRHKKDPALKEFRKVMEEAVEEHRSASHVMVRLLGAVLKVDPGYLVIAGAPDLSDGALREVANGTKHSSCIVASRRTDKEDILYSVHIQGRGVAYYHSLSKAYHTLTIIQNLLFLEGAVGTKSIGKLVEAVNLLSYAVKYRKTTLGRKYNKIVAALDRFIMEDGTARNLK